MAKTCAGGSFGVEYENIYYFQAPRTKVVSDIHAIDPLLLVILTGQYYADCPKGQADRMVRAGPGDVVYWPGGMDRTEWNSTDEKLKDVVLRFRWTSTPPALPRMVHDHRGVMRALCEVMAAVAEATMPQRKVMLNAYLSAIIAEYVRLAAGQGEGLEAKVAACVREHMRDQICLDDLAEYVKLSPLHLCRKYKALTGRTPMEDVRRIKAEYAASTLRCHDFGLKTVAEKVGLDDPLMLSKWLHKYVGIPVRDLRK